MAPLKPITDLKNKQALREVKKFVIGEDIVDFDTLPENISLVKGLFNRVIKQDQWDWFTVNMYFDYPTYRHMENIVKSLRNLRNAISYNNNALAMNPLNFFAEMKDEGNPITKTNYGADNFSLWVEQDTVIAGKQLYFISSGVANGGKAEANIRYYLAAKDTTRAGIDADTYAMFISHDSIKTMKNNPALFAFKTAEEGGYYLENQKELNENGKPYVGVVNGFAVMQATPSAAFEVQTASAPTANEEMNVSEIKVISNDGQVIVTNASGKMITLSNILGQIIGVRRANSEYFSMPATSGIVLVTVEGDATYKVIVK